MTRLVKHTMTKQELMAIRERLLEKLRLCNKKSWRPNRYRSLQAQISRLTEEIDSRSFQGDVKEQTQ